MGLLAACVKIDGNTSIPQSLLATIHTEGKKRKRFPRNLSSPWSLAGGQRTGRVCIQHNGMCSESLGNLGNKRNFPRTLLRWGRIELRGESELLTMNLAKDCECFLWGSWGHVG